MEAGAAALAKVYCFGPTFRAEKSSTRRHLLEFWMVEPEMAFCSYKEAMLLAEKFVEYVVQNTIKNCRNHFKFLGRDIGNLEKIKAPFPKISYKEACDLYKKQKAGFYLW